MFVVQGGNGQGSNSVNVRLFNERVILTTLRRLGAASKADLARAAGFTDNTAGVIVRELQERRLIRVEGKRTGARGQPATLLTLNPHGACSIGVKVGRRSIDATLVDFCGTVMRHRRLERAFPPPWQALTDAVELVTDLRRQIPVADGLVGLGLAMPYNMGSWHRELDISSAAFGAWNETNFARDLQQATGLPVVTENDGTAAAVAELFRGLGRELSQFLYVFLGTAIGGGVVLGGRCFRGLGGNAGDIGLMPVPPSRLGTAPRPEGPHDVLLTRASISSLIRHLRERGVRIESRADLDLALLDHAHLVDEWLDDCADALVMPLLSAARLLDLGVVVFDGDLPDAVIGKLIDILAPLLVAASPESREAPRLRRGVVGRAASAIGAAILPLHLNFSPNPDILVGLEPLPDPLGLPA